MPVNHSAPSTCHIRSQCIVRRELIVFQFFPDFFILEGSPIKFVAFLFSLVHHVRGTLRPHEFCNVVLRGLNMRLDG